MRDCVSAAEGFARAIDTARNDLVVFVRPDVYLPHGWDGRFRSGFEQVEARIESLGVVGVFGTRYRNGVTQSVGRVVDRDTLRDMPTPLPVEADGIDDVVVAVRRPTSLRLDPELGFDLYGTDVCLSAEIQGRRCAVVEAPCFHNALATSLSPEFHRSREYLLAKWPGVRPLHATVGRLDEMDASTRSRTWQEEQRDNTASLRRELRAAQKRIERMESSPFWKARGLARRAARLARAGRPRQGQH